MPSNFKTYEAQSRLLAAVLASCPELKLNFKAIAAHYGSDTTSCGMEHRFRPIKKQAAAIREAVAKGVDPKDMQDIVNLNEKEIAKFYGESTPQGLEFQFRAIKSNARKLQEVSRAGGNTATALDGGPATPRKRKATGSAAATPSSNRGKKKELKVEMASDEEFGQNVDYDELDAEPHASSMSETPSAAASTAHPHYDVHNGASGTTNAGTQVSDSLVIDKDSSLDRDEDQLLSQHSLGSFDAPEDDGEC